jgi:predicted Zn-ribbon and HTH transcriptional regulator
MSLRSSKLSIEKSAHDIRHMLFEFESRLRIANAARIISTDFLDVFVHEIDSVQRSLKSYLTSPVVNPVSSIEIHTDPIRERKTNRLKIGTQGEVTNVSEKGIHQETRRDRVLGVLKDKGEATIKDVIEVVTDCSEKTIQRELMSLIKDNIIVREGERRWSKYKII